MLFKQNQTILVQDFCVMPRLSDKLVVVGNVFFAHWLYWDVFKFPLPSFSNIV